MQRYDELVRYAAFTSSLESKILAQTDDTISFMYAQRKYTINKNFLPRNHCPICKGDTLSQISPIFTGEFSVRCTVCKTAYWAIKETYLFTLILAPEALPYLLGLESTP